MRVGVIGTKWGLMHVGAFRGAGCEVTALCSQNVASVTEIARRERVSLATNSVDELCYAVDLVVVASPDALHASHVKTALLAGKHVFSEKPMTRTLGEALALMPLTESRPAQVYAVNFPFRFLASMRLLKAWLARQTPLKRIQASLRTGFGPPVAGALQASHLGASGDFQGTSHGIDAALWFADDAARTVQAQMQGFPAHSVGLLIETHRGIAIHLSHLAVSHQSNPGTWVLAGDDWEVRFDAGYVPSRNGWVVGPVEVFHRGASERENLLPQIAPLPQQREPWAQAHVDAAVAMRARIDGDTTAPLASALDGLHTQWVLAAALQSAETGMRIVTDSKRP